MIWTSFLMAAHTIDLPFFPFSLSLPANAMMTVYLCENRRSAIESLFGGP